MTATMMENKKRGVLALLFSNLDTIATVIKLLLPASLTGALIGWATWFAGLFSQYAPASWIFAAVIGALLGSLGMFLLAYAREKLQAVRFRNTAFDASRINPLDPIFETKRIRIADLAPPFGAIIENKTFVDCDLVGPANVIFESCHFSGNRGEVVDALIIRPGHLPRNGTGFRNCMFRECRFYYVTFMVPEPDFSNFSPPNHDGLNWITERPDQPPLPIAKQTQQA